MLTPSQLTTLKANIIADPVLSALPNNDDGAFQIMTAYNLSAVPDFFVWRTTINVADIMRNGFDWTRVDNLTVGKARIWEFMTSAGTLDPSRANVRAGFEACFSVEAGDQSTRQGIYNECQRLATRAEKLFAAGAGTTSTHHGIGPATMAFTGSISLNDVLAARAL
jgi:hypothetical protein